MAKKNDYRAERGTPDRQSLLNGNLFNSNLWGTETEKFRAFAVTTVDYRHQLLEAILIVKRAAALANADIGMLEATQARSFAECCDEILDGQWRDQLQLNALFPDGNSFLQTAVDEVLANRSLMIRGLPATDSQIAATVSEIQLNQKREHVLQLSLRIAIAAASRNLRNGLLDLERLLRRKSLEYDRFKRRDESNGLDDSHDESQTAKQLNQFAVNIQHSLKRLNETIQNFLLAGNNSTSSTEYSTNQEFSKAFFQRLTTACNVKIQQDLADSNAYSNLSQTDLLELSSALKMLALELQRLCQKLRPEIINQFPQSASSLKQKICSSGRAPQVIIETIMGDKIVAGPLKPETVFNQAEKGERGDEQEGSDATATNGMFSKGVSARATPENDDESQKSVSLLPLDTLHMAALDLLGCDAVVTACAHHSPDEFNQLSPLMAKALLSCVDALGRSLIVFNIKTLTAMRPENKSLEVDNAKNYAKTASLQESLPTPGMNREVQEPI
ncbi:MAG TPA: lyase family protein [Oculatellaceae cyanobacterium]